MGESNPPDVAVASKASKRRVRRGQSHLARDPRTRYPPHGVHHRTREPVGESCYHKIVTRIINGYNAGSHNFVSGHRLPLGPAPGLSRSGPEVDQVGRVWLQGRLSIHVLRARSPAAPTDSIWILHAWPWAFSYSAAVCLAVVWQPHRIGWACGSGQISSRPSLESIASDRGVCT